MITTEALFDLSHTVMGDFLRQYPHPWAAIPQLCEAIWRAGRALPPDRFREVTPGVWVAHTASVAASACLLPPCIIDEESVVRHCAFLRGAVVVGKGCTVGNSTELKNTILLDGAQLPHLNYAGDSVIGYRAHLGAGAVISNLKCDRSVVCLRWAEESTSSGLIKLGAMVGDGAEVGCNCVLNPGTILGRFCTVYPLLSVRGSAAEGMICKSAENICRRH